MYGRRKKFVTEKMKEITAVQDKYGLAVFNMGLTHLMDVGVRHMTDENIEAGINRILAEANNPNSGTPFITPKLQCGIIRCAAELAKFSIWELFAFIKKHIFIQTETNNHEAGTCPNCRNGELEYDGGKVTDGNYIYKWRCEECNTSGREIHEMIFREHISDAGEHECPLGGDISDDCTDCVYAGDYCYDSKTGDCIRRPE